MSGNEIHTDTLTSSVMDITNGKYTISSITPNYTHDTVSELLGIR